MRQREGISQRELASRIQMDMGYLSRMENDLLPHLPSQTTIEKLVSALNLSITESDELYILAGKVPSDVRDILLSNPKLIHSIRRRHGKGNE